MPLSSPPPPGRCGAQSAPASDTTVVHAAARHAPLSQMSQKPQVPASHAPPTPSACACRGAQILSAHLPADGRGPSACSRQRLSTVGPQRQGRSRACRERPRKGPFRWGGGADRRARGEPRRHVIGDRRAAQARPRFARLSLRGACHRGSSGDSRHAWMRLHAHKAAGTAGAAAPGAWVTGSPRAPFRHRQDRAGHRRSGGRDGTGLRRSPQVACRRPRRRRVAW
jgi:hypothetical protein